MKSFKNKGLPPTKPDVNIPAKPPYNPPRGRGSISSDKETYYTVSLIISDQDRRILHDLMSPYIKFSPYSSFHEELLTNKSLAQAMYICTEALIFTIEDFVAELRSAGSEITYEIIKIFIRMEK